MWLLVTSRGGVLARKWSPIPLTLQTYSNVTDVRNALLLHQTTTKMVYVRNTLSSAQFYLLTELEHQGQNSGTNNTTQNYYQHDENVQYEITYKN